MGDLKQFIREVKQDILKDNGWEGMTELEKSALLKSILDRDYFFEDAFEIFFEIEISFFDEVQGRALFPLLPEYAQSLDEERKRILSLLRGGDTNTLLIPLLRRSLKKSF